MGVQPQPVDIEAPRAPQQQQPGFYPDIAAVGPPVAAPFQPPGQAPSYQAPGAGMVNPVPGIPVKPPLVPPQAGQVVVRYDIIKPESGCCKCDGMKSEGVLAMILLLLFFPWLAFIPCCMSECFEDQQRPVYGYPAGGTSGPPVAPVAQPPPGY